MVLVPAEREQIENIVEMFLGGNADKAFTPFLY